MKTLITIILAFVLWVLAGGYWWVQQTKGKIVDLATELYQSGVQWAINTTWSVSQEVKTAVQIEIDKQIEQFKAQAKAEASNYIKSQIDEILK